MEVDVTNHQANARIFKALCDPKRLAILGILRTGSMCACDLIEQTGIAQSALSYHMKILVESSLVESWQCGKWMHYKISQNGRTNGSKLFSAILEFSDENQHSC